MKAKKDAELNFLAVILMLSQKLKVINHIQSRLDRKLSGFISFSRSGNIHIKYPSSNR
ncbi:hypothetical protein PASE110613_12540 [Paenibacillus sediminis]|uniref:Uncharacterized protein n=1 Tax=Paenibacillus sediminis TaxID=664909 RepID=A0ABS4H581_9BACL|nr:hypothetical protein [Paenibacillus sediminis]